MGWADTHDHSHQHDHGDQHDHGAPHKDGEERVVSLRAKYTIGRDGNLTVAQQFELQVDGNRFERGPCLSFLTVYQGPGGLILDNRMSIQSVRRNGNPEPYHIEFIDGMNLLFIGDEGAKLEHGIHQYEVEYSADGDWKSEKGSLAGAFDVLESFEKLEVDSASIQFEFPEGTEIRHASVALTGHEGVDRGYRFEVVPLGFTIETTGKLRHDHQFFLNLVLSEDGFVPESRWLTVMQQHPKLPISAFTGFALCWALVLILSRARQKRTSSLVAS